MPETGRTPSISLSGKGSSSKEAQMGELGKPIEIIEIQPLTLPIPEPKKEPKAPRPDKEVTVTA
jgi:hypothetical protein